MRKVFQVCDRSADPCVLLSQYDPKSLKSLHQAPPIQLADYYAPSVSYPTSNQASSPTSQSHRPNCQSPQDFDASTFGRETHLTRTRAREVLLAAS